MGLLEKAQQLKESTEDKKKRIEIKVKKEKVITNEPGEVITIKEKLVGTEPDGLLKKVREKRRLQSENKKASKEIGDKKETENLEVIEKNDIITTNEQGEVIGIITSTAAILPFIKESGSLPQNVNWAVKTDYLRPLIELPKTEKVQLNRGKAITLTKKSTFLIEAE